MGRERRWQHLIAPRDFSNYLADPPHQQYERDDLQPVHSRNASARAHTDHEREECEDHDSYERAAHRKRYPCYGADPDEGPEKGTAIEQAEREYEGHQDAEQDERCGGPRAFARSTACRVRPHEPGVADREEHQGS